MKRPNSFIVFIVLNSFAAPIITASIQHWGKVPPAKEAVFIILSLVLCVASLIVFSRGRSGDIDPAIKNVNLRRFINRYPFSVGAFAMVIGIIAYMSVLSVFR